MIKTNSIQTLNEKIKEIPDLISSLFTDKHLLLVILFGSACNGKIHKRSDIDLAFLYDKPVDILELTNKISNLVSADNIDVIDLKTASPLLKFSIAKTGKLIYEKQKGLFAEFSTHAFKKYVDTKKLRDMQKIYIKSFLKKRGVL